MSEIVVHEWGPADAPTLLLVHGLTEAGTAWPDAVARWSGEYHVLAVDQRGHGRSPRFEPEELTRSHEVLLADLVGVLDGLPEPPVLVGHSLGGLMALRAGDTHPELVRALVLEDPAMPTASWQPDEGFVAAQEEFLDRFADGGAAEAARMRRESGWTEAEIDGWAACKPLVDRRYIREGLYLGEGDWEVVFNRLEVPTLVVAPDRGEMAPDVSRLHNPRVRLALLPGVGHCVRRDDPVAYHGVVDEFVRSVTH